MNNKEVYHVRDKEGVLRFVVVVTAVATVGMSTATSDLPPPDIQGDFEKMEKYCKKYGLEMTQVTLTENTDEPTPA